MLPRIMQMYKIEKGMFGSLEGDAT
jgi:hypothetical protein